MAKIEALMTAYTEKYGSTWVAPVSLKQLIAEDRIRIAGTDNVLILEVDGEAWPVPITDKVSLFR